MIFHASCFSGARTQADPPCELSWLYLSRKKLLGKCINHLSPSFNVHWIHRVKPNHKYIIIVEKKKKEETHLHDLYLHSWT